MLAVKATYENGKITWAKQPKVGGRHELIVVFEDVDAKAEEKPASEAEPFKTAASWQGFESLIGCVAERPDGSERHDAYLAGNDKP